jgi:carbamoyl-phosphate synthase large subunit
METMKSSLKLVVGIVTYNPDNQTLQRIRMLLDNGIETVIVRKNSQGTGPLGEKTIVDLLNGGDIDLVINTPVGRGTRADGWAIRTASVQRSIPIITTTAGFSAAVEGIKALQRGDMGVTPIQEWLKQ